MRAKSIKGKSPAEIEAALDESMSEGLKPTLAIVFLQDKNQVQPTGELFNQRHVAVFGASAHGQFIDREYDTDSIVVMLLEVPPECFRIEFRETGKCTTKEIAQSIGAAGRNVFRKPAFIVASGGVRTDGEKIVEGILEGAGAGAAVFGGLAASGLTVMETFVFTNGKHTEDGLVAIIFDEEKIGVNGYASGGCQPVGIYHTITESKGNIVYTIDGKPALDLVMRYCGKSDDELKEQNLILSLASFFQIQAYRENASPILRTPMHANYEDRSLVFAGSLKQGSKVKFSILPGFEVVDNVVAEFGEFSKKVPDADAMILFSCQGRQIAFGPWMGDEIQRLGKIWNSPMIGLFSFGEIGCGPDGKYEFYNMTCSLVMLNEKNGKR